MALHATQVAGGAAAEWAYNDFLQLLTGVMTDQAVTISYAPGSSGSTPTVKLVTNGNAPILQGYNSTNQKFSFDASGNLSLTGNLSGPVGGGIPTTRNGVATSAPIYTSTTTPSSPPTGSIWVKA